MNSVKKALVIATLSVASPAMLSFPGLSQEQSRPSYCKNPPPRGLSANEEQVCRLAAPEQKSQPSKSQELQPPKYPVTIGVFQQVDPGTGTQLAFNLESKNGSTIDLVYAKSLKPKLSIDSQSITSWKASVTGTGTDSSSAISTAVAGALFFWPMMLAAPFMVSNYTIMGFQVDYVDEYGGDKTLAFATINPPKPAMELLKYASGLDAGTRRPAADLKPLYQAGLQRSMDKLAQARESVLVKNTRKPWCSYVDLSKQSTAVNEYKQAVERINTLHSTLGLEIFTDSASTSSDSQWQEYLQGNPSIAAWAAANKKSADALKKC